MENLKLLLLDERAARSELRILLARETGLEIVGETGGSSDALALALRLKPDVLVMGLAVKSVARFETIRQMTATCPETGVVVLSAYAAPDHVERAFDAGARAYVVRHTLAADLPAAVRAAARGKEYFSPAIQSRLASASPPANAPDPSCLEARLRQLIAQGRAIKQMAGDLRSSIQSVRRSRRFRPERRGPLRWVGRFFRRKLAAAR